MKKILFLCTGNSCRSQMAEGFGKHLLGADYEVYSAGTKTHGLNPNAVKVMSEIGIDISTHKSKTTSDIPGDMDLVVTVCSDADENCPYFPAARIVHRGFDDPPRETVDFKDEDQILEVYRRVRDEIKDFVSNLKSELKI